MVTYRTQEQGFLGSVLLGNNRVVPSVAGEAITITIWVPVVYVSV